MSDPRASIQRAVAGPPQRIAVKSPSVAIERVAAAPASQPIGKPHGRLRCVNLSLSEEAASTLRQLAEERSLTLGEALMEAIHGAEVPHSGRRGGRLPQMRRNVRLVNVYALLTPAESSELSNSAAQAGRSVSDFADCAIRRMGQ